MSEKSLLDLAFEVINESKGKIAFKNLFEEVISRSGRTLDANQYKKEMAKLYTQLSLDGRFASFEGNTWDLRSRYEFKDTYVNIADYGNDDEDVDEEEKKLLKEELGEDEEESYEEKDSDSEDSDEEKENKNEEDEF